MGWHLHGMYRSGEVCGRGIQEGIREIRDFVREKASDGIYLRSAFRKPDFCLYNERCRNQMFFQMVYEDKDRLIK